MHFYLTQLGLARYLNVETPTISDEEYDPQVLMAFNTWKDADYMCRNYVPNSLNDTLYNVYYIKSSAKELWESLDRNCTELRMQAPRIHCVAHHSIHSWWIQRP
ncbi:unnamed protein product [Rhodiola kirilowii]